MNSLLEEWKLSVIVLMNIYYRYINNVYIQNSIKKTVLKKQILINRNRTNIVFKGLARNLAGPFFVISMLK